MNNLTVTHQIYVNAFINFCNKTKTSELSTISYYFYEEALKVIRANFQLVEDVIKDEEKINKIKEIIK